MKRKVLKIVNILLTIAILISNSGLAVIADDSQDIQGMELVEKFVYMRDSGEKIIDADFNIIGDGYLSSATVKISENYNPGYDVLSSSYKEADNFWLENNLIGAYDSSSGIYTISGIASVEKYEQALRSIKFATTADTGLRKFEFSLYEIPDYEVSKLPSKDGAVFYYPVTGHYYQFIYNGMPFENYIMYDKTYTNFISQYRNNIHDMSYVNEILSYYGDMWDYNNISSIIKNNIIVPDEYKPYLEDAYFHDYMMMDHMMMDMMYYDSNQQIDEYYNWFLNDLKWQVKWQMEQKGLNLEYENIQVNYKKEKYAEMFMAQYLRNMYKNNDNNIPIYNSWNMYYWMFVNNNMRNYYGENGYLATVTSKGENDFLFSLLPEGYCGYISGQTDWISRNEIYKSAAWRYNTGPEKDITFSIGNSAVETKYTNWSADVPSFTWDSSFYILLGVDKSSKWKVAYDWTDNYNAGYFIEYGESFIENKITDTVSVKIIAAPTAPTQVSITAGDKSLNIKWGEPIETYNEQVLGYNVYLNGQKYNSSLITGNSYDISGLVNGTEYEISVSANTIVGEGKKSEAIKEIPYTIPDKPGAPSVERGNNNLTVRWKPPFDGGKPITGYYIYVDGKKHNVQPVLEKNEYIISGLSNYRNYNVSISAINLAGESLRSAATAKSPSDLGNEPNILVQGIDSYDLQTGKFKVDIILNNVKADAGTWGLTFDTEILKNGKFVKEGVIESLLGDEASYAVNNGFHTYRWYAVNGEVDGTVLNGKKLGTYEFDISLDDYQKKLCRDSIVVKDWTTTDYYTELGGKNSTLNNEIWSAGEEKYNVIPVITNSQSSILSQSVFTLFNYDNGDKSKIKFNVTNAVDDSNIEGAIITITGSNNFALTTDSDGIAYNVFKNGEYNYTITKGGYATKSGNFNVSNLNNTINIKLYNKYKVEWSISNGSIAGLSIGDSTVTHGEKYEFHIISDEGKNMVLPKIMVAGKALLVTDFTFDMDTGEGFIPADKVTGNIYLSSILANKEYKITATAGLNGKVAIGENSNSTGTVYQNNVEYGSNSSLIKFTADDGYEINKVYVDGEEKTVNDNAIEYSYVFANVTKDSTIEATFKEFTGVATFKVTDFNNDLPISGASINIEIFNSGENMVLTSDGDGNASVSTLKNGSYKYIITKNGYATKKGQFSIYNGNTDINVKLDTKYSLNWFIKNGTIDGNDINQSGKISLLEDYTFTIKANDGYDSKYFSANDQNPKERPSIYIDDVDVTDNAFYTFDPVTGIGTLDKSIITGDVSINAVFSKVKYDVRLKAGSNGKIKVGNETPVKGELSEKVESGNMTRMYEFIADSGYEIESVKVNGVAQSIDNDITSYLYMGTNINENKNIEVTFKTLTYTVEGLIDYVKQSIHDNTNKGTIKFKRAGLTDVQATFLQHKKQGKFTAELVPGTYTLEVLKDGYTKYEITGIKITNEPITLPQTIKLIAGDATWDKELISLLDVSTIVSGVRNKSITRADIDEDSYNSVIDVGYAKSNYSKTNILVTWEDFIK